MRIPAPNVSSGRSGFEGYEIMLTTILTIAIMAVAAGVALAVVIKMFKNVRNKAIAQGVVISDGVQMSEVALVARLIQEELKENADLEALKTLKRVVDKAASMKGL